MLTPTPLDAAILMAIGLRRFRLLRRLTLGVASIGLFLFALPPQACGCFQPTFRRCSYA